MKIEKMEVTESRKDPWFAVMLSYLVAGLGQVYAGKPFIGGLFFSAQLLAVAGGVYYCLNHRITSFHLDLLRVFVYLAGIASMFQVFYSSRKKIKEGTQPPFYGKRNPFFAAFISLIIPGLGQAYNGNLLIGFAFMGAYYLSAYMFYNFILGFIFMPLVQLLAAVHAYENAFKKNGSAPALPKTGRFVLAAAISGFAFFHFIPWDEGIKNYVFETGLQDSADMEPAIGKFDFVYLDKAYYGVRVSEFKLLLSKGREINRGELLCFKTPNDETVTSILRCIGLPGDKIELKNKQVSINGKELQEPYALFKDSAIQPADIKKKGVFGERDNLELLEIPAGMYFLMGDNRDAAVDSRTLGLIPRENITGKAEKIQVGKILQDAMKLVAEMSEAKKTEKEKPKQTK